MSRFRAILEDIIIPQNSVLKIIYEKRKDEILEIPEGSNKDDYHIFGIVDDIGKKYNEDPDFDLQDHLASLKQAIMRRFRIQASQMKQWLEELKEQENQDTKKDELITKTEETQEKSESDEDGKSEEPDIEESINETLDDEEIESQTEEKSDDDEEYEEESFSLYEKKEISVNNLTEETESDDEISFSEKSLEDDTDDNEMEDENLEEEVDENKSQIKSVEEPQNEEESSIPSEVVNTHVVTEKDEKKIKERKKIVLTKSIGDTGGFFDDVTIEKKEDSPETENEQGEDESFPLYTDDEIAYDRSISQNDGTATAPKENKIIKGRIQKARKEYEGEYGGYYSEEEEIRGSLNLEDLLMLNDEQASKEELGMSKIIEYMIQMTKKIDILSRRLTTVESQMPHTGMLEVGSMFKAYPDRIELYKNNKHYLTLRNTFHNFGHRTDVISMRNHVEYEGDNWVVGISPNVQTSPNIPKYTYSFDPVKFEKILQRLISKK